MHDNWTNYKSEVGIPPHHIPPNDNPFGLKVPNVLQGDGVALIDSPIDYPFE